MELQRKRLDISLTAQDALRALRGARRPFALVGDWAGGGAILGCDPLSVAEPRTLAEARALIETARTTPPAGWSAFRASAAQEAGHLAGGGGIGGGWFGWLGYGLGGLFEPILPPQPPRPRPRPLASLAWYDHVLRLDAGGAWWFEALAGDRNAARLEERRVALSARLAGAVRAEPWRVGELAPAAPGYAGHLAAVAECVERIRAGEIFQANLCLRLEGELDGSAIDAFAEASAELRPARGAYVGIDDGAILSFSPELFLARHGDRVESRPIKGTAPRLSDPGAGERLRDSAKDVAENLMIVDLMRNDLGRVARYGTVEADRSPSLEEHPGLWHLVSGVRATLREGTSNYELVAATFPPGSVTGAPKIQASKVISALEGTGREAYTGAIGFASPVAGLELSVAIRTFELHRGRLWLGAGGGVVADSRPEAELAEALDKARPLAAALGATIREPEAPHFTEGRIVTLPGTKSGPRRSGVPEPLFAVASGLTRPAPEAGLLETIAVRQGTPASLGLHLERLAASAAALWGLGLPAGLAVRALAAAEDADGDLLWMRIVARPEADALRCEITTAPAVCPTEPVTLRPVLLPGGLGAHKWADRSLIVAASAAGATPVLVDADGCVLEAGWANVWLVEGERLVTAPADGRLLAGLVRACVLETAAAAAGFDAVEEHFDLDRLGEADAIVLTSSVSLAVPATLEGASGALRPYAGRNVPGVPGERVAARLRGHLLGAIPAEVA